MIQLFIFNEISRAAIYGIGTYIQQLIACLNEDFQINIVNYYSDKTEFAVLQKDNVREFYIPRNQLNYTEGKCDEKYFINSVYLLFDFIEPDAKLIFHFNHFRYEAIFSLLREYWPSCKIVLSIHYFNWCFPLNGNTTYFRQIINKLPEEITETIEKETVATYKEDKSFLHSADHIICLAQYAKYLLCSEYDIPETKMSLLYNGLKDEALFLAPDEKSAIRKQLHLTPDEKIILYAGRLDDIKGVDHLIQAFRLLLQERDDCHLVIIGDGEYAKCLKECTDDWGKIIFTGKLTKEDVYRFYQVADVGVMLSKHEQCSFVAIEMMMHGLPIIASNSTGLDEMVQEGYNGYKIPTIENKAEVSFDIDQCYRFLSRSLKDENSSSIRERCRTQYETIYSLEQMRKKMLSIYQTI